MKQTDHQMMAVYDYSHLPNIGQYHHKEVMVEGHMCIHLHTHYGQTQD